MRINSPALRTVMRRFSWEYTEGRFATIAIGFVVVILAVTLILSNLVSAASVVIKPNGDISLGNWTTTGGGTNDATCSAGTTCDFIDEGTTGNTTDFLVSTTGADVYVETALEDFTLPGGVTTTDSVTVGVYATSFTLNGGTVDDLSIQLMSGATQLGTFNATLTNGSYTWLTSTLTGSWTQSEINDMRIRVARVPQGSGNTASRRDVIRLSTVYAQVNYTTPITYNQSSYRFIDSAGTPMNTQNTVTTVPSQGTPFRLRFLLTTGAFDLPISSESFKIQVATKSGTCSASTYADMTQTSGDIRLFDTSGLSDGSTISGNGNDPTYLTSTKRPQTYVEGVTFTNSAAAVANGESGLWEISLVNYSGVAGSSYCFRVVKASGTVLNTYTVYPEITTAEPDTGKQFSGTSAATLATGSTLSGVRDTAPLLLDFTAPLTSATQTITPQFEIQPVGSSFTGTPNYSAQPTSSTFVMPPLRMQQCSAYDPVGQRMIVFGGQGNTSTTHYNDTWALNMYKNVAPTWTQLTANGAGGSPSARRGCAMAYDSLNQRMIMFAGRLNATFYNDVWVLSLGTTPAWTQLCTASSCGTAPGTRAAIDIIYDSVGHQIFFYGGYNGTSFTNDMWRLTLSGTPAWTALTPSGTPPSGRAGYSFEFDPVNRVGWSVAGTTSTIDVGDTWKYDIVANSWTELYPYECALPCPNPLEGTQMVYDSANKRLVLYGGHNWGANAGFTGGTRNVIHILSNLSTSPTWTQPTLTSALPHKRYYGASVYDPINQRMVVFAGENRSLNPNGVSKDISALYLPTDGTTPYWRGIGTNYAWNARDQGAPYYDQTNKKLYLFGGFANGTLPQTDTTGAHVSDTFRLDLQTGKNPRWLNVNPLSQAGSASIPIAREAVAFATDTSRNRLVAFGGLHEGEYLNDTWIMTPGDGTSDPVWSQLCTATSCGTAPPSRWLAFGVYDSTGDRLIVFGGEGAGGGDLNDAWALSLSGTPTWTNLNPGGTVPGVRFGGAAVYDAPNNRMVIFGGQKEDGGTVSYNTTHALSLGGSPSWSTLSPTGTPPAGRRSMGYSFANIGGANKLITFAGYTISGAVHYNDISVLDLSTTNGAWTTPYANNCSDGNAPACRRSTTAVYDSAENALIVTTGRNATQFYGDTFKYNLTSNTWTNLNPIVETRYTLPVTSLSNGAYHWQYRVNGSSSGAQPFRVYGGNSDTPTAATDFGFCGVPTVDTRMRLDTYFCTGVKQNKAL